MNKRLMTISLLVITLFSADAMARDESAAATQPAEGTLRVVCFGDSVTGYRPNMPYRHAYLKFSDLLQLMLEARLGAGRAEVINSGYAGDRTYTLAPAPGALSRLQADVLAHRPHIAIVLIGGNDPLKTDEQRKKTRESLEEIAGRLKAAGIKTLMLQYHKVVPDPLISQQVWTHINDANRLQAAAATAAGVELLDLGPAMAEALKLYQYPELLAGDGIHLAPRGEVVYARAIFARLDQLGWVAPPAAQE